ncbi:MAG: C39 family peptidase [Ruminococcus sp.]|nr:C39 family peptidase [Ruminococcus sp.]
MNRRMTKRRKTSISPIIIIFTIIIALVLSVTLNSCTKRKSDFECNHNASENKNTEKSAVETVVSFAADNGLALEDWPTEIIELLKKNPETEDFVLNYPLLKDTYQDNDLSEYADTDEVPLFMQWDKRWGYTPYGEDMLAISGCGPTCLSMVCVHLLNDTSLNPRVIAQFSEENDFCAPGDGTKWTLISEGAVMLGLNVEEVYLDESNISQILESGNPIICAMGPGNFTSSGHYIVLTDYVDGMIKINDPNSIANSEKLWSYDEIAGQIDNLWECSLY